MVEIPVSGCGELQGAEADVIQRLVIYAEGFIRVLHQLVDRERGVVRLHHGIRYLEERRDGKSQPKEKIKGGVKGPGASYAP